MIILTNAEKKKHLAKFTSFHKNNLLQTRNKWKLPGAGGRAQAGTGNSPCGERPWLECWKPRRGEKEDTVRDIRVPGRGVGSLCKGEIGSVRAQVW